MGISDRKRAKRYDRFLKRCPRCGELRGEVAMDGCERAVRVVCLCESGLCPRCRRPLLTTPMSVSFDEVRGKTWHEPILRTRCAECGPLFATIYRPPGN